MARINSLTPEQERMIPAQIEKWVAMAHGQYRPADAAQVIRALYQDMGKPEPTVMHSRSTVEATCLAAIMYATASDVKLSPVLAQVARAVNDAAITPDGIHVNHDVPVETLLRETREHLAKQYSEARAGHIFGIWTSAWAGLFEFARGIGVKFNEEKYTLFDAFSRNVFSCIPHENICIVVQKPIAIAWEDGLLHSESGPAVEFADGWALYALHGVAVPRHYAVTPVDQIEPQWALRETNTERRMALLRRIGAQKIAEFLGGKTLHSWTDIRTGSAYALLEIDLPDAGPSRALRMTDPSTGEIYVEYVPPTINTCEEALTWRVGGAIWDPKQLT